MNALRVPRLRVVDVSVADAVSARRRHDRRRHRDLAWVDRRLWIRTRLAVTGHVRGDRGLVGMAADLVRRVAALVAVDSAAEIVEARRSTIRSRLC